MMYWYGFGWPWAVGMWGGMVLFWGLIALAIYAVVRLATHPAGAGDGHARRVLDERLARGEIDVDEYRRLRDLMSSGGADRSAGGGPAR